VSLRKRCSQLEPAELLGGAANPLHCPKSPRCNHHWFADFRVNGKRYRVSTATHDKGLATKIEATERTRILEGKHGIRRQKDVSFREAAKLYLDNYAAQHKLSASRDAGIVANLNQSFGPLVLHEITGLRILQWQKARLAGTWRAKGQKGRPKPVRPGTVNRELDTLRAIFARAVEWRLLVENPAAGVKRLKVENRRTRVLSDDEQIALIEALPRKARLITALLAVTGARVGEVLGLRWDDVTDGEIVFWRTKNGKSRRLPLSPATRNVLSQVPRVTDYVFTSTRTRDRYTVNGYRHTFRRALDRAGITTGDVSPHTLRHTALSRMIARGASDHTVMAISGHSSTRMLERYTHPTEDLKVDALESGAGLVGTFWAHPADGDSESVGGRQEDRTPDLRVANAALSQLS
jgi:integrase